MTRRFAEKHRKLFFQNTPFLLDFSSFLDHSLPEGQAHRTSLAFSKQPVMNPSNTATWLYLNITTFFTL